MNAVGIDVGSVSTEAVIINGESNILGSAIIPTGSSSRMAAERAFESVLKKANISSSDISYIVTSGYGRLSTNLADREITEITCHAKGAHFQFPNTRTVIDIGGQDTKVISLDNEGKVLDFVMNDKCAAGTGRFLEVMAHTLEVDVDQLGELSRSAQKELKITSTCTVFTESEVVSRIAEGCSREDIAKGLHNAIAGRVINMAHKVGINEELTLTGGVIKNVGIIDAIKNKVDIRINIPSEPQIIGALGAALLARRYQRTQDLQTRETL